MKKNILILIMGLLLLGVNVFAQGDLVVNGNLGIGTSTPLAKLGIVTDSEAVSVDITQTSDMITYGGEFKIVIDGSTNLSNSTALRSDIRHIGTSDVPNAVRGGEFQYMFRSTNPGTSNFTAIYGFDSIIRDHTSNARNYTGSLIAGMRLQHIYDGTGTITVTDLSGALFKNPFVSGTQLQATNLYGMQIEKQTKGTNNYGIALLGDGAGADVVFGTSKNVRIYSQSGRLWAQDSAFNKTVLSPHDPETGEWVYYSKNVKTGKVVKVNMEQLVKAVEKLTGEKFMIETIDEIE